MLRGEHRAIGADDEHAAVARERVIKRVTQARTQIAAALRLQRDAMALRAVAQKRIIRVRRCV